MKDFKTFLSEARTITIKDDKALVKALLDLEANVKDNSTKDAIGKCAEYVESKGLDRTVASKLNNALSKIANNFSQKALVNAIDNYIESNA